MSCIWNIPESSVFLLPQSLVSNIHGSVSTVLYAHRYVSNLDASVDSPVDENKSDLYNLYTCWPGAFKNLAGEALYITSDY